MNTNRLERNADLLLLRSGFDKNGKKMKWKGKGFYKAKLTKQQRREQKNIKSGKDNHSILKNNKDLIKQRKSSELSDLEQKIAEYLASESIEFQREYYMKGLFNPKTRKPLFFDFYIKQFNLVIEYDGLHHFKNDANPKALAEQKYKDEIKNQFCQRRKIYLLRIPYWKQGRIEKLICERVDQILMPKK